MFPLFSYHHRCRTIVVKYGETYAYSTFERLWNLCHIVLKSVRIKPSVKRRTQIIRKISRSQIETGRFFDLLKKREREEKEIFFLFLFCFILLILLRLVLMPVYSKIYRQQQPYYIATNSHNFSATVALIVYSQP